MSLPSSMRAWQYSSFGGGDDALKLVEIPVPSPAKGQVLVKVQVATVNALDWKLQDGGMRPVLPPRLPFVPGMDLAGEVVALPPDAEAAGVPFRVGDQVIGGYDPSMCGAYAEYAVLPVASAALRPEGVTAAQGASLVVAGCAALQALRDAGGIPLDAALEGSPAKAEPPLNLMVANGSGGVGVLAIQMAKLAGVHVTATCGARNVDLLKSLGADEVLDYKTPEGAALKSPSGKKYDLLLDGTPNMTWSVAGPVLGPKGKWLHLTPGPAVLGSLVWPLLTFSGQRLAPVISSAKAKDLALLAKAAGEGKLKVIVDSETPFAKLPEAWQKSKGGRVSGKLIITVD